MELQNHYDGKLESELRKQVAKEDLKRLFYRSKNTSYFEKYITKTKQKLMC